MPLAFVALGANLADPVMQVRHAVAALAQLPESRLLRTSSLYRTQPVGIAGQPDFINAVAALETTLTPHALLAALGVPRAPKARASVPGSGHRRERRPIHSHAGQPGRGDQESSYK